MTIEQFVHKHGINRISLLISQRFEIIFRLIERLILEPSGSSEARNIAKSLGLVVRDLESALNNDQ